MLIKHVVTCRRLLSRLFLCAETKNQSCENENFRTLFSGLKNFFVLPSFFQLNLFPFRRPSSKKNSLFP